MKLLITLAILLNSSAAIAVEPVINSDHPSFYKCLVDRFCRLSEFKVKPNLKLKVKKDPICNGKRK